MTSRPPPSKVLVIAEGQIGDLLLLTPVFRAIKLSFPDATVSLIAIERRPFTETASGTLVESRDHFLSGSPYLSSVHIVRRDLLRSLKGFARIRAEWEILRFVRREKFDTIISAFPDDRFSLMAFFSGAKTRVGESHSAFSLSYTAKPARRKGEGSILEYFCELAELAGCRVVSRQTEFVPSSADEEWAEGFLKASGFQAGRFLLIHPGATGDYKIWPPERFAELMQRLSGKAALPFLLCGGPRERELVAEVSEKLPPMQVQVHLETRIGRFASLAKRAALVISNDSGPRHVAVAVGAPSLAIFRKFHDREWGVYGELGRAKIVKSNLPCADCPPNSCKDRIPGRERYGSVCIRAVEVSEVMEPTLQILGLQPG